MMMIGWSTWTLQISMSYRLGVLIVIVSTLIKIYMEAIDSQVHVEASEQLDESLL